MSRPFSEASYSEHSRSADGGEPTFGPDGRFEEGPELGRGAMGRVVRLDDALLARSVARKEASGMAGARLLEEGRILARLQHPGIVPIHDAGVRDDGSSFLVLSHIDGATLSERLREGPALGEILRWLLAVARAVGHAHSLSVVHRDLKPDNIMVTPSGEAVVVDWGLARVRESAAAGAMFSGTRAYASPEQLDGAAPDPRADVFSLGVVLREALAAAPRVGREPPELMAIVGRALDPRPSARYADANELADDLLRYLEGRRVRAHAYTAGELARRFVSVFRWPIALTVVVLSVVGALLVTGLGREARLRALAELELARALVGDARGLLESGQLPEALALSRRAHALAPDATTMGLLLTSSRPAAPIEIGRVSWPSCDGYDLAPGGAELLCRRVDGVTLLAADGRPRAALSADNRGAVFVEGGALIAVHLASQEILFLDREGRELGRERLPIDGLLMRQPGRHAALALAIDSVVRVGPERPSGSRLERVVVCPLSDVVIAAASSPDGTLAAFCRGGALRVFGGGASDDEPGGSRQGGAASPLGEVRSVMLPGEVRNEPVAAAIADGELWVGTTRGDLWRLDLATLSRRLTLPRVLSGHVRLIEPSSAAGLVLIGGDRPGMRLIDLATGSRRGALPLDGGREATFSGETIVTFGSTSLRLTLAKGGVGVLDAPGGVTSLSLEGERLAIGHGREATLVTLDGERVAQRAWHRSITKSVALRGGVFAVANRDIDGVEVGGELVWHLPRISRRVMASAAGVLVATYSGGLELWRPEGGHLVLTAERVVDLDGVGERFAALGEATRSLYFVDLRGGAPMVEVFGREPDAAAVALSPDEEVHAAGRAGVMVYGLEGPLFRHLADGPLIEVAVSAEGDLVAASGQDGRVFLWRSREQDPAAVMSDHDERVTALRFGTSAATRLLLSGSWDETVRVRDLAPLVSPQALWGSAQKATHGGTPTHASAHSW